jgi:D-threo-aldose 1-dehydrogenase
VNPSQTRPLGRTGVEVTQLGFGAGTLGDPFEVIAERQAEETLAAAWDAGLRFYDTAPWYGNTKSEHRTGHFLRTRARGEFVLSTKVGRVYFRPADPATYHHPRWAGGLPFDLRFDYSGDGVRRAYEDSLQRLGINTVDALVIHDIDPRHQRSEEGVRGALGQLDAGGGYAVLDALRASGEVRALGAGVNHVGMIPRFLERFELDYFLVAMPYTLLDQPALDEELALCEARGVGVVIGAVFASGVLATGAAGGGRYAYQPAGAEVLDKVRRIESVCARHGVPLAAAALQFPLGHPTVASVIPGPSSPAQARQNAELMRVAIPAELWAELKAEGLLRADAPTPS